MTTTLKSRTPLMLMLAAGFALASACDDDSDSESTEGGVESSAGSGGGAAAGRAAGGRGGSAAGSGGTTSVGGGSKPSTGAAGSASGGKSGSAAAGVGGVSASSGSGASDVDAGSDDADAGSEGLPAQFTITHEKTACFGRCPVYVVSIDQAGRVEFDGQMNTAQSGQVEKTVPAAAAADVYEALLAAGYWDLNDSYVTAADGCGPIATDHPTMKWTVVSDGETKSLTHYLGCKSLAAVNAVDEVSDVLTEKAELTGWIGSN